MSRIVLLFYHKFHKYRITHIYPLFCQPQPVSFSFHKSQTIKAPDLVSVNFFYCSSEIFPELPQDIPFVFRSPRNINSSI